MRGIGRTLSRLPAASALLAGAILAATTAQNAYGQSEETAFAVPRGAPLHGSGDGIVLPQPLAPSDAARLRRIFAAQAKGDIPAALRDQDQIDTASPLGARMLGHVLADRYLGRFHHSSVDDLTAWLARYADLPDAPAVYSLLKTRLPKGATPPGTPPVAVVKPDPVPVAVPEEASPATDAIARTGSLDRDVHERARAGNLAAALHLIARTSGMKPEYSALLRAEVAQIMFTLNRDADALDTAAFAARICGGRVGLADYVAGLAAWRLDRPVLAVGHFEAAAAAPLTPPALTAAASFWAARTHLRLRDPAGYVPWMKKAADQKRTFYGILARRALGIGTGAGFAWDRETLGNADIEALAATPSGQAAFALLQIGENDRADSELRLLWAGAQGDVALGRAIMLVADKAELYDLAAQLAAVVQTEDGRPRDYARFPVPHLVPRGGFSTDPALVYALTRVETNFDASAISSAGARGLMQLMPATASYIAGDRSFSGDSLHDPAVNLELGQRYVSYLAGQVDGDLIRLLSCYNAGPGSFARWSPAIQDGGDPLLFIESIPLDETRGFVQHVLAYTWIYAARLHLPAPSLDELAAGAFPHYHVLTTRIRAAALH